MKSRKRRFGRQSIDSSELEQTPPRIPIRNIYYLLSYAWDALEEADFVDADSLTGFRSSDLLAHLLVGGTTHILKRGIAQGYIETREEIAVLRGRVDFGESIRRQAFQRAHAICDFDEYSPALIQNRILKTTIRRLARTEGLDPKLASSLSMVWRRMAGVPEIELSRELFRRVCLPRGARLYQLLMNVCELAYDSLSPLADGTAATFREFTRDKRAMDQLFQRFVFNFYRRELGAGFEVRARQIKWDADSEADQDAAFLPIMQTDVTVCSDGKCWVIDTKYYREPLQSREGGAPKLISENLYQIFSYVKNLEAQGGIYKSAEGILLYPTIDTDFSLAYQIQGHRLRGCTINLNAEWHVISDSLLSLLRT